MYWKLRTQAITTLLIFGLARLTLAGLAEDQYAVAAHHYTNSRWEFAVDEFTEFLQQHPDHERAETVVFFLAESLVQLGRHQAAHDRFTEYLARSPDGKYALQSRFRVGETLYLAGRHEEARDHLEDFRHAHGDDPLCAYVYAYLGEIALATEQLEEARTDFADALKLFPEGPLSNECRLGLARALEGLGEPDAAIRFYRFLADNQPPTEMSDDALLQLAILFYQQGKYDEAIAATGQHRERFPGSELAVHATYWLGLSLTATGQYDEASVTLSQAADRYPEHDLAAAIAFATGEAFRRLEDFAEAERYYERVVAQHAHSSWADDSLQTLVQLAWQQSDNQQVQQRADQFADEFPDSPLLPLVRLTSARALLKEERYDQVITVLEPMLDATPDAVPTTNGDESDPEAARPHEIPTPTTIRGSLPVPATAAATRYYLALGFLGAQQYERALDLLGSLSDLSEPRELLDGVRVARASALLSLERYAEAIESLHVYLTSSPDGADAEKCRAQLVVTCARLGRWPEVERVYAQMQRAHQDQTLYLSTLAYLSEAAYSHGQREFAERLFRALAQDDNPEKYVAQGLSGQAWLDWSREDGAAQSAAKFERLLKRFPDSPLAAEAAMMRGQSLEKTGAAEGALAMYRLVVQRYAESPHASSATLAAARIHDALEQDREAEPLLRQWLDGHSTSDQRPAALYQLAWVLVDLTRESEADEVFEEIYQQHVSSRYWSDATYRLAERAARAEDYERADALAAEIVQRAGEPHMVGYALYLRGQLAAAARRWDDVVSAMQRLIEEDPKSPQKLAAEYWLAEARYRLRQYDQAGELFDKLDMQTQGLTDAWMAMIPLRRAQVRAHRREWEEAYEIAIQIKTRFPQFAQQHEVDYLIGRYYASRAEFDQARKAYEQVIRSECGRATETAAVAQWMIGETYFMQKQYNQAIRAYHRVEGLYDYPRWKAGALLQAGKCHEMVGRWTEATELYAQIVQDYSQTRFADQAARRLKVAQQRADLMSTR